MEAINNNENMNHDENTNGILNPSLVFRDGKLFAYTIKRDNTMESVDVTKQVAKALAKYIGQE